MYTVVCLSGVPSNSVIKTQVAHMYGMFASEIDPKSRIMDRLIQENIITIEQKERVLAEITRHVDICL